MNIKRKITRYLAVAFASAGLAQAATAASVRFDSLEAMWTNPTGGSNITMSPGYGDPVEIKWGVPWGGGSERSGYSFDAVDTPFTRVQDAVFALGEFTHINKVINIGTGISTVELFLKADLTAIPDAGPEVGLGTSTFRFLVKHEETPNSGTCPVGSTSICDDVVSITALDTSDTISIGGIDYTLSILGFATSVANAGAGIFDPEFLSPENGSNTRVLAGKFTVVDNNPAPVPLPAGLPMLLIGLGALGIIRRSAQKKA